MAPLVDWRGAARGTAVVVIAWSAVAILGCAITWRLTGSSYAGIWIGLTAIGATATSVAVLAASALRGMLRAGERGERLSGDDVGLLPPRRRS